MVRVGRPRASILLLLALTTALGGTAGLSRAALPAVGVLRGADRPSPLRFGYCSLDFEFDGRIPAGAKTYTAVFGVGHALRPCGHAYVELSMHATAPVGYFDWICQGSMSRFVCHTIGHSGSFVFKPVVVTTNEDSSGREFAGVYTAR